MLRFPTLWKYTRREMQRRPGRTLLTLLGIVIGVAAVVAITATTRATRRSYRDMFEAVGGRAALEVVAEGQGGFEQGRIENALEGVAGIESAAGVIQESAGLLAKDGILPVLVLGMSAEQAEQSRAWRLREGNGLGEKDGVLLVANFARQNGYGLGDRVRLVTLGAIAELHVVGLLEAEGAALFNGGSVVVLPLPTAQRLFGMTGQVNSVQLFLSENADPRRVEAEVSRQLPVGFRVQEPPARATLVRDAMMSTDQALAVLSVVSVVGGAFVILNSFLMNLGERRRSLAILRALGTTRGQITRLLLREALLLGGAGTVLGIGAGVVLAQALVSMYEQLLKVDLPPLRLTAEPFLAALLVGPGVALAATLLPAWRAGQRSPLEAMLPRRSTPEQQTFRPGWVHWLGLALILLAFGLLFGTIRGWFSLEVSTALMGPETMLLLIGCVLALPLVLGPLTWFVGRLLRPLLGVESALAVRQLQRQHTRTSLTVGVLFIGIIMTIGFGNSLLNNLRDIDTWYRETIPSDFLVRGIMPDTGTMTSSAISRDHARRIEALDGVAEVGKINFVPAVAQGMSIIVIARDFPPDRVLPLAVVEGTEQGIRSGLWRGEVVLATGLARRTGLGIGDELILRTRAGQKGLRVVGVVKEYSVGGMVIYLDWGTANELLALKGVNAYEVHARPGEREVAETSLRRFARENGLLMHTNAELRREIDDAVAAVEGFMWVLIALVFVIASMGIVNTLTMNVQEQTRELGVLRAVGMKRGQVAKMVVAQALAMGLLSVLPGILGGIKVAYAMYAATYPLSGHQVAFALHPGFIVGCAVVALVVAVLASLPPARRAARLPVIQAVYYE